MNRTLLKSGPILSLACFLTAFGIGLNAEAQVVKLSGTAPATANWNSAATWTPSGIPNAASDVVFDYANQSPGVTTIVNLNSDQFANSLTFGSTSGPALGAFTLNTGGSARTLTLTSGNITLDSSVTGNSTLGGTGLMTLKAVNGAFNINNNSSSILAFASGGVALADSTVPTSVTYGGTGTGLIQLATTNTYTGLTTVSSGANLRMNSAGGLGSTAAGTVVNSGGTISVNNVTIGAEALTLNGAGVAGAGGALVSVTTGALTGWTGAITLGSDSTVCSVAPGGGPVFALTGGVNTGGHYLTVNALNLTNTISINTEKVTGTGGIVKTGLGLLVLSGANDYTGKTTINAGTVEINSIQNAGSAIANSLGTPVAGADSIIDLAGTLNYTGSTAGATDRVVNLTGSSTITASGSGLFALNGGITNSASSGTTSLLLRGTGAGGASVGAISNGTGTNITTVNKTGTAIWTFTGVNTYKGATQISGGTLNVASTGRLAETNLSLTGADSVLNLITAQNIRSLSATTTTSRVNLNSTDAILTTTSDSGGGSFNGSITGTGGLTLGSNSLGATSLGAANTYSGNTTINGGSLILSFGNTGAPVSNILSTGSHVAMGGGNFRLGGKALTSNSQLINGLDFKSGSSTIQMSVSGTADLLLSAGAITRQVGATASFLLANASTTTNGVVTTSVNDANGLLGPGMVVGTNAQSLNDWATISNGNVVAFTGYTVGNDTSLWGANQNISSATGGSFTGTVNSDVTINSLRINTNSATPGAISIGSGVTLSVLDGILLTGNVGGPTSINGGSISGSAGGDLIVLNNGGVTGVKTLTIGSTIVDNTSATAFTKSGAREVLLGGNNTYTGATYVNEGILSATGAATSGHAFGVDSAVYVATNATLNLGGTDQSIGSLSGRNSDSVGAVTLGAGTLTTGSNNTSTTFRGVISGTGGFRKVGTGTQTLTAANTYTGPTTVSLGTLVVSGSLANNSAASVNIAATSDTFVNAGGVGTPKLTRTIATGTNYAGYGATSVGGLNTVMTLLAGSNTTGTDIGLSLSFRDRNAAEIAMTNQILASNVTRITDMANNGSGSGQTDVFVLQLTYDASLLTDEAALASSGDIYLAYLNGANWIDAINGNYGTNTGLTNVQGSWAVAGGSTLALGSWGVDIDTNVVWAVVDHNTDFGVIATAVPEPSTWALLGLGTVCLLFFRRRAARA